MAQNDMNIANQGFPAFRADLNDQLEALVTNSSGATAPATTFPHQWWLDTSTTPSTLRQRNAANDAWIVVGLLNQSTNTFNLPVAQGGTGAATLTNNAYLKGAGTNAVTAQTGIPAGDITSGTLGVARGGTGRATLTANNVLLGNGTSTVNFVAPGTTGNVLTSNGTTWQSTALPPASVTTNDVLNATAGAAVGAVGTYTVASTVSSGQVTVGSTAAGSILRGFSAGGGANNPGFSGTWINMGCTVADVNRTQYTVFLRIS